MTDMKPFDADHLTRKIETFIENTRKRTAAQIDSVVIQKTECKVRKRIFR